ncbi:MAG: hypothetical protein KatS3mg038_3735 [Candidatus Kapaibacterium sp.]|nr:MAG: hypothetical protein KatS3mg038_2337 [Candidatus Kapabacteria bacterium]GIV53214.1 MAG: hypothetical protein KatS3mg038_3735 [Candidatus Kapabacteria bacterium]
MSKVFYVAASLINQVTVEVLGKESPLKLPPGCVGILFAYRSPEEMKAWHGDVGYFCLESSNEQLQCQQSQKNSDDGSHSSTQ